ncbi:hypothetical protein SRHO_G00254510 [Serrasalmus rhombeus]
MRKDGQKNTQIPDGEEAKDGAQEQPLTDEDSDTESSPDSKVDYLENYSRQNNVCTAGLKEGTEGRNPVKFSGEWLPQVLGDAYSSSPMDTERAHRTPNSKPALNEPPRLVLIRFLHHQDREKILRLTKEKENITIPEKKVNFSPDMSLELVRHRKQMIPALKALKERNFTCYITYPARLRVQLKDGKFRLFNTPGDVSKFIDEYQT